jgi:hypothetical protein
LAGIGNRPRSFALVRREIRRPFFGLSRADGPISIVELVNAILTSALRSLVGGALSHREFRPEPLTRANTSPRIGLRSGRWPVGLDRGLACGDVLALANRPGRSSLPSLRRCLARGPWCQPASRIGNSASCLMLCCSRHPWLASGGDEACIWNVAWHSVPSPIRCVRWRFRASAIVACASRRRWGRVARLRAGRTPVDVSTVLAFQPLRVGNLLRSAELSRMVRFVSTCVRCHPGTTRHHSSRRPCRSPGAFFLPASHAHQIPAPRPFSAACLCVPHADRRR